MIFSLKFFFGLGMKNLVQSIFIEFSFIAMEFFAIFFSPKPAINFMLSFFSFIYRRSEKKQAKTAIHRRLTKHKIVNENGTQEELWNLLHPALTHTHCTKKFSFIM